MITWVQSPEATWKVCCGLTLLKSQSQGGENRSLASVNPRSQWETMSANQGAWLLRNNIRHGPLSHSDHTHTQHTHTQMHACTHAHVHTHAHTNPHLHTPVHILTYKHKTSYSCKIVLEALVWVTESRLAKFSEWKLARLPDLCIECPDFCIITTCVRGLRDGGGHSLDNIPM